MSSEAESGAAAAGEAGSSRGPVPEGVPKSVLRQVEYYFSDSNFPKDKFLMAEVAKSEEGWVGIATIAKFNKVKSLVPTEDVATVADALRYSNFLEVSEDGTLVRRPGTVKKVVKLGSIEFNSRDEVITYARGLIAEGDAAKDGAIPSEGQEFVKALLELHDKAEEKKGPGIEAIRVGRNPEFPETSCFVVARTDGSVVDFSYLKCLGKVFPLPARSGGGGAGGSGKKRKAGNDDRSDGKKARGDEEAGAVEYETGKIVVIRELPEGNDRFTLKDKFGGSDKGCAFVEVVPEMPLAYIRFNKPEEATAALAVEGVGEISLLTGDDEKQYWDKIASGGGGRGGGRGGGGRGRGGKGKGKGKGKGGRGKKGGRGR
jgi:hypothetical protein